MLSMQKKKVSEHAYAALPMRELNNGSKRFEIYVK